MSNHYSTLLVAINNCVRKILIYKVETRYVSSCVRDKNERNNVIENLNNSGLEIIDISINQMTSFLGNCIQLVNSDQSPKLIMSSRAFNSITKSQIKRIESHTEIIHSDIKTIENNGGGSARCMIAEIF